MTDCTYCGCEVEAHDPVVVREGVDEEAVGGHFCNYACLREHIDEAGLAEGASCRVDLPS